MNAGIVAELQKRFRDCGDATRGLQASFERTISLIAAPSTKRLELERDKRLSKAEPAGRFRAFAHESILPDLGRARQLQASESASLSRNADAADPREAERRKEALTALAAAVQIADYELQKHLGRI